MKESLNEEEFNRLLHTMESENKKAVDFSPFFISSRQIIILSKFLKENKSVRELSLASQFMDDVNIESLAEALTVNTSLTEIDLRNNDISDKGAQFLLEAIKKNLNLPLKALHLQENPISQDIVSKIYTHISWRASLSGDISNKAPASIPSHK